MTLLMSSANKRLTDGGDDDDDDGGCGVCGDARQVLREPSEADLPLS